MRLAIFTTALAGGGGRVIANLIKFLPRACAPRVILRQHSGEFAVHVPTEYLRGRNPLTRALELGRIMRRNGIDVVLSLMPENNITALLAKRLFGGVKVVICEHTQFVQDLANLGIKGSATALVMRLLYPSADAIVAVSRGLARDVERLGVRAQNIHVIPNPFNWADIRKQARESIRHPWFARHEVLVAIGRLSGEKGFDVLLRAFARVRQQRPVKLVILGEGPERAALLALARDIGVDGDAELMGFQPNPFKYLARASAFISSSRWEGFGNVIVEALGLGVPVVATDCPTGPRELLQAGKLGTLVPPDDADALGDAILRVLRNRSKPKAVRPYDAASVARRYDTLIRTI